MVEHLAGQQHRQQLGVVPLHPVAAAARLHAPVRRPAVLQLGVGRGDRHGLLPGRAAQEEKGTAIGHIRAGDIFIPAAFPIHAIFTGSGLPSRLFSNRDLERFLMM